MHQPPGFEDSSKPHHVSKLKKSIYGLKQAPQQWYKALRNALLSFGFIHSATDNYCLVYVDDIIVTDNNKKFTNEIIEKLGTAFSIKDMGNLNFFLGIEVLHTAKGLFLSQHKYVWELLTKTSMDNAKEVQTPMSTTAKLTNTQASEDVDGVEYRKVIGALQYLGLTRLDIAFSVNRLAQFIQNPKLHHWAVAKRLLRYLKQTMFYGILLQKKAKFELKTYSDAD